MSQLSSIDQFLEMIDFEDGFVAMTSRFHGVMNVRQDQETYIDSSLQMRFKLLFVAEISKNNGEMNKTS